MIGEGQLSEVGFRVSSFEADALTQPAEPQGMVGAASEVSIEGEFTQEELRLEREISAQLVSLEAVEAAVMALQAQRQIAQEDSERAAAELRQLREAFARWDKASDEGQRELQERESLLSELVDVLPPDMWQEDIELAQKVVRAQQRVAVLEKQTTRLREQVVTQQAALSTVSQEKKADKLIEALTGERDARRAEQREARQDLKELEERLSERQATADTIDAKRKALARETVKLRAEASGLRVSLATAVARTEEATADAASRADSKRPSSVAAADTGAEAGLSSQDSPHDARLVSLVLQRLIVRLWEELRQSSNEAQELTLADLPGAPEPGRTPVGRSEVLGNVMAAVAH